MPRVLRVATRSSEQARAQAQAIADRLIAAGHRAELLFVETTGDIVRDRPIWEIGGRGIFVKEVQRAVLDERADLAVHSAKDLPSSYSTDGLVLASVPERGDVRDALVGSRLADLRHGAVVATGSQRRQALLAHVRPDLRFVGLRGNIPSRIAKADSPEIDAIVVAVTGAAWVGLEHRLSEVLDPDTFVPQVGQGALALECRSDDRFVIDALSMLQHVASRTAVDAERSFLAELGGGCELPVGAYATVEAAGRITIRAVLGARDGSLLLRADLCGDEPSVGAAAATELLAQGGAALL
jgi:hydroxymethylbilane synthase